MSMSAAELLRSAGRWTGEYICPECGENMKFTSSSKKKLKCMSCGFVENYDDYGYDRYDEDDNYIGK